MKVEGLEISIRRVVPSLRAGTIGKRREVVEAHACFDGSPVVELRKTEH
jgi:hypothetical protein